MSIPEVKLESRLLGEISIISGRGMGFSHSSVGKASACNAGDLGLIPGSGRSSGERNGN